MNLPLGFTSLDQLAQSKAGHVYLSARCLGERQTYERAEDYLGLSAVEIVQITCEGHAHTYLHPDCYARMYDDGSILACSNADDEVWADERDYLDRYDLERVDDEEIGWVYRPVAA